MSLIAPKQKSKPQPTLLRYEWLSVTRDWRGDLIDQMVRAQSRGCKISWEYTSGHARSMMTYHNFAISGPEKAVKKFNNFLAKNFN